MFTIVIYKYMVRSINIRTSSKIKIYCRYQLSGSRFPKFRIIKTSCTASYFISLFNEFKSLRYGFLEFKAKLHRWRCSTVRSMLVRRHHRKSHVIKFYLLSELMHAGNRIKVLPSQMIRFPSTAPLKLQRSSPQNLLNEY